MTSPSLLAAAELVLDPKTPWARRRMFDGELQIEQNEQLRDAARLLANYVKAGADETLVTEAFFIARGFEWGESEFIDCEFLMVRCRNCSLRYLPSSVDAESRLQVVDGLMSTTIRIGRPTIGQLLLLLAALGVEVGTPLLTLEREAEIDTLAKRWLDSKVDGDY